MHSKTLRIYVNGIYPWTVIHDTQSGKIIDGIDVILLNIIAEKMGFDYVPLIDDRSIVYPNGTPGAALGEVR